MRLFVAVYLSEEVNFELKRLRDYLKLAGLKEGADFHITLKFLGDVSEEDLVKVKKGLSTIKFKQFKLKLKDVAVISPQRIRVVHCNIMENSELDKLADDVNSATSWIKRDYPFNGHITLYRVKFLEHKQVFLDKVRSVKVKNVSCEVSKFYLVKSELTEKGSVYDVLEEYDANDF